MEENWVTIFQPNPQSRLRLFCFPYAGGGTAIFRKWHLHLPESVEVCPISLPGRGRRMREPSHTSAASLVTHLTPAIKDYLDKPYAFFGHSMGALICFELAHQLRRAAASEPVQLFVSGCRAPQLPDSSPPTYELPDVEFWEKLRRLNGTPHEVLMHPELMQMLLPLLRADFEVVNTYRYSTVPQLTCPISVYGGLRDAEAKRDQLEAWRELTAGKFTLRMFEGDHFFLHQDESQLLRVLSHELLQLTSSINA